MNRPALLLALVLALLGLLAALLFQRSANNRLAKELEAAQKSVQASQRAIETTGSLSRQLEEKMGRMTEVLNQSTERLTETSAKLKEYEAKFGPVGASRRQPLSPDEAARLKAQVPAPQVEEGKDRSGKVVKRVVFTELTGKEGKVLATNAEFGSILGRRLFFRRAVGSPLAFDVDELHPGVLAYLDVNPEEAKYQQVQMDQQKKEREAAAYKDYQARQIAERKAWEVARAEQARTEEARRKQQAELDLKYRELENDRIRAEAQLRAADAAMTRAVNSAPYYYNQVPYYVPLYPFAPGTQPTPPTPPSGGGTANPGSQTGQRGNLLPAAPMLPRSPFLTNSVAR